MKATLSTVCCSYVNTWSCTCVLNPNCSLAFRFQIIFLIKKKESFWVIQKRLVMKISSGLLILARFLVQFLYFYLPLFILCTLNMLYFAMTSIKIRQHQMEMRKIVSKDESRKHRKKLENDKNKWVEMRIQEFQLIDERFFPIDMTISFLIFTEFVYFCASSWWWEEAGLWKPFHLLPTQTVHISFYSIFGIVRKEHWHSFSWWWNLGYFSWWQRSEFVGLFSYEHFLMLYWSVQ